MSSSTSMITLMHLLLQDNQVVQAAPLTVNLVAHTD
jgi:hypothetical protein